MNKLDELNLFKKMYSWLKPNGKLILDCPETASLKHSWSKEFSIGIARGVSSFDEISRIQNIQFYFQPHGEEEFGIYDPYDLEKRDLPGIIRYLYPKSEIIPILENIGLTISEIDHYYEKNYFGLMGIKKPMLETK